MLHMFKYSELDENFIEEVLTDCLMANFGYEIFLKEKILIGDRKFITSIGFRGDIRHNASDLRITIRFEDSTGKIRQILLKDYFKHYLLWPLVLVTKKLAKNYGII